MVRGMLTRRWHTETQAAAVYVIGEAGVAQVPPVRGDIFRHLPVPDWISRVLVRRSQCGGVRSVVAIARSQSSMRYPWRSRPISAGCSTYDASTPEAFDG